MLFLHILYNMETLLVLRCPVIFPPFATLFFLLRLRRFLSGASRYTNQTFFLSRSIPTQSLTVLSDAFRHPSHPPSTYDSNGKERENYLPFFCRRQSMLPYKRQRATTPQKKQEQVSLIPAIPHISYLHFTLTTL